MGRVCLVVALLGVVLSVSAGAYLELRDDLDTSTHTDPDTTTSTEPPFKDPRYRWEWTQGTVEPCSDAVLGGVGITTTHVTLGRVHYFGHLLPSLVQRTNTTSPTVYHYGGQIYGTSTYEVLCGTGLAWVPTNRTQAFQTSILNKGINTGYLSTGETVLTCRAISDSLNGASDATFVPGLVDPETKLCNISISTTGSAYNQVYTADKYELLIEYQDTDLLY